jgi:hypothetical protein
MLPDDAYSPLLREEADRAAEARGSRIVYGPTGTLIIDHARGIASADVRSCAPGHILEAVSRLIRATEAQASRPLFPGETR